MSIIFEAEIQQFKEIILYNESEFFNWSTKKVT